MTLAFRHTAEGDAFICSGDSRETSFEIMAAIAAFAADEAEAVTIWEEGIGNWDSASARAFVDTVTGDGQRGEPRDYVWGAAGSNWVPAEIEGE